MPNTARRSSSSLMLELPPINEDGRVTEIGARRNGWRRQFVNYKRCCTRHEVKIRAKPYRL